MKMKFNSTMYHTLIQCYLLNETSGGDKNTYYDMVLNYIPLMNIRTAAARYHQLSRIDINKCDGYSTWFYKRNVGVQRVAVECYSFRFAV